ncbi:MAG: glutathione S-transferase [Endozoicomonas sp.]
MKLFLNTTSPYARVIRIFLQERGLSDCVELVWCDPWSDDEQLLRENPVGKIPALVTDSGIPISESLLIANYLNDLGQGQNLIPIDRKDAIYHLTGLGQGLMDASFTTVISRKYSGNEEDSQVLGQRRQRAIQRTLQRLEGNIDQHSDTALSLGDIVVAVALDYLLFRLPELDSANQFPGLEAWRKNITQRPSFESTAFKQ